MYIRESGGGLVQRLGRGGAIGIIWILICVRIISFIFIIIIIRSQQIGRSLECASQHASQTQVRFKAEVQFNPQAAGPVSTAFASTRNQLCMLVR